MQYRKVIKLGGSLYVGIPASMQKALKFHTGDVVRVSLLPSAMLVEADSTPSRIREAMTETKRVKGGELDG